ncbi:MAG: response regulator, partial [Planctomycetaceae bacterium]|nr:response regulator [Planctomycetaceae bacterium]
RLEDLNQAAIDTTGPVNSELLVGTHDLLLQLEHAIVQLTGSVPGDPDATVDHADAVADGSVSLEAPASPSSSVLLGDAILSDVDETVRVPITRLGELMDSVAELLVLNGPRSSLATRVKDFATTVRCNRNRLACCIDQLCELHAAKSIEEALPADQAADSADRDQAFLGVVRHLSEQADDLLILAENLRGVAVPMADDADIAARLTRHLWELLQDIRVVSIRPLLQRLARVARAASKIEGKQVRVVLEGEDALLDRLMQDKVFEPLLHIVRNAVGHGIERPADRTASGKDPEGTVWITAVQAEDTLTFTVRDDGRGLDYARIEQRARDLGLLHGDERPDVDRLTEFIFRSGFSTRAGADALSGRGVGMDIVSSEVTRLQGTVRLQSEPGQGTSVTVRLPAQISLEQAMVFSVDGQHFALPLKSVDLEAAVSEGELSASSSRGQGEPLCARSVLGYPARPPGMVPVGLPVLIEREVRELLVDKIEGPYELVARPLNPLLADHPVVSGTSLAVDGELVLLLDPSRLATYQNRLPIPSLGHVAAVLVVDDSISVRRTLVNYLTALGLEVDEAGDGVEALKFMKERAYCFVITDLHMPRKDGFQLLADLEKDSKLATTPVIVSSARFDEKTHQSVLRLGAKAVLPKPVGMEKLAEVIAPLINVAG